MSFLNSLHQIRINKKDFKAWEQENLDKDKQREALVKAKPLTAQQLQKAQAKGKVIMDTIDIMDTHSEEVAENTETVIMPLAALLPTLSTSLVALGSFFGLLKPANIKESKASRDFNKSAEGERLSEIFYTLDSYKEKIKNGDLKIRSDVEKLHWRLGDKEVLFNKKNLEILSNSNEMISLPNSNETIPLKNYANELLKIKKAYNATPNIKALKKAGITSVIAIGVSFIASFIYANVKAAKIQVQSSRVARWQSRQDLNDPKYFVQYTPEQLEEAKRQLEAQPQEEEKQSILTKLKTRKPQGASGIHELVKIIKDNKHYKEWKKEYNQEDKKVKRQLTPEELEEAKKDQEVIQRITKTINNKAEEYSENMETTGGVLIGATPFLGIGIGALVNQFAKITKIGDKISQKAYERFIKGVDPDYKDIAKSLFKNGKQTEKQKVGIFRRIKEIFDFGEKIQEITKNTSKSGKKGINMFIDNVEALFNGALATSKGRGAIFAITGGAITGLVGALIGLKLQKNSARAGRYIAKREIEKDPANFIGYSDSDWESVKNIKAEPKTLGQKFVNYITFLPRVIKEYFEYEKYNNTTAKYNKKLREQLAKGEVSEEQLKEAKNLQRKLFTTFENVDDKSQEFSESVEAATEMAQPFIPYVGYLVFITPLIIGGITAAKGGVPKILESFTGFFAKHSKLLKKKFVGNYTKAVSDNISKIVAKQEGASGSLKKVIDILSDGEQKSLSEILKSLEGEENQVCALLRQIASSDKFKDLSKEDLTSLVKEIMEFIPAINANDKGNKILLRDFEYIMEEMKGNSVQEILNEFINQYERNIPNWNISRFSVFADMLGSSGGLQKAFNDALKASEGKDNELLAFLQNISSNKALQAVPRETLMGILEEEVQKGAGKISEEAQKQKIDINKLLQQIKETKGDNLSEIIQNFLDANKGQVPSLKVSKLLNANKLPQVAMQAIKDALIKSKGQEDELLAFLERIGENQIFVNMSKEDAVRITKELLKPMPDQLAENLTKQQLMSYIEDAKYNNISELISDILGNYGEQLKGRKLLPKFEPKYGFTPDDVEKLKDGFAHSKLGSTAIDMLKGKIKEGKAREVLADLMNDDLVPHSLRPMLRKIILSDNLTNERAAQIFENLITIIKNVPAKELNVIFEAIKKEISENPDKFIQAARNGELYQAFMTSNLENTIAITTGSWAAISLLFTYALESAFASLQKSAGRLGVMKAIEELEDPSYYADNERKDADFGSIKANNKKQAKGINAFIKSNKK